MSEFTPKFCECANPNQITRENADCKCCKHQQALAGWNPEYCKPCILTLFPLHLWGLWELLKRCRTVISLGMGGVLFDVDINKFQYWAKKSGIKEENEEEILDLLDQMNNTFQDNQKVALIGGKEVEFLKECERLDANKEEYDSHRV